jgi:hypothetical protein
MVKFIIFSVLIQYYNCALCLETTSLVYGPLLKNIYVYFEHTEPITTLETSGEDESFQLKTSGEDVCSSLSNGPGCNLLRSEKTIGDVFEGKFNTTVSHIRP